MRCWSMSGKSAGNDVLNGVKRGVKNDVNVAEPSIPNVTLNVTYQTSMKFLKDGVALKIFVL
jgi:hypothetical protein